MQQNLDFYPKNGDSYNGYSMNTVTYGAGQAGAAVKLAPNLVVATSKSGRGGGGGGFLCEFCTTVALHQVLL